MFQTEEERLNLPAWMPFVAAMFLIVVYLLAIEFNRHVTNAHGRYTDKNDRIEFEMCNFSDPR